MSTHNHNHSQPGGTTNGIPLAAPASDHGANGTVPPSPLLEGSLAAQIHTSRGEMIAWLIARNIRERKDYSALFSKRFGWLMLVGTLGILAVCLLTFLAVLLLVWTVFRQEMLLREIRSERQAQASAQPNSQPSTRKTIYHEPEPTPAAPLLPVDPTKRGD